MKASNIGAESDARSPEDVNHSRIINTVLGVLLVAMLVMVAYIVRTSPGNSSADFAQNATPDEIQSEYCELTLRNIGSNYVAARHFPNAENQAHLDRSERDYVKNCPGLGQ